MAQMIALANQTANLQVFDGLNMVDQITYFILICCSQRRDNT